MGRHTTKTTGVLYRDTITNGKADKTYYIRYKDVNNKTREIKIGKYSEGIRENYCNQKRNEIITKQRLGEEPPSISNKKKKSILSIEKIAESYFEQRDNTRSTLTDKSNYNKYIKVYFNDIDIDNLNKTNIDSFSKYLQNITYSKDNKKLAEKTINNILNLFKTIIKYGVKNDFIKNDVSKYVKLFSIDNARERFLSKGEINTLFESSKNDDVLYLIYKIALNTGARLSSILNIQKNDIDFTHELLTLKDFKNKSTYKAFLTEELSQLLENYIINHDIKNKLFISNPERRLRALLNDLFNKDIEENDRKNKIVFHTLRHTFASHLAINGTPIFTIQKLMNHKDIKMTLRYAKLSPDSGRDAVKNLYTI
ncbi:tyrosine-type recombinase/integrase [Halarcobacter sp.]|uniref:tyrosine-type recombinase/integrase n=1 Tax=Halarcobacter sp. TaxID=2321133 RepID=UPI003A948C4C